MEEELIKKEIHKKKKIITSNDQNNINYYKELNPKEPKKKNKHSIDYYELLKQQIKYYKELNASLKEEIETVKKCKKIKQLEEMNDMNKLTLLNKDKDDINNFLSSANYNETQEKMRQELTENELKITDLQTRNKMLEESVTRLKNTLDLASGIFPNFIEKVGNYTEGSVLGTNDIHTSSNYEYSKNIKKTNVIYSNTCNDENCLLVKNELKRLEDENQRLKSNVIQLNQTIKYLKSTKNGDTHININDTNRILDKKEYIKINENIRIYKHDLVNDNMDKFNEKLYIDNKRLRIYIEKIDELQKLLNKYKKQINSLFIIFI